MTMLLMSSGKFFTEKAEKLLDKNFKDLKIAYITTAAIPVDDKTYVLERQKRMKELGWDFEEIDIANKKEDEVRAALSDKQIVYLGGGNAFFLLIHIRESGFERVIRDLLDRGVIFAGSSAGAYVACPTIEMARWFNRNNWDDYELQDLTAMNLVPFLVKAHYTVNDDEVLDLRSEECEYEVRALSDDQAVLVEDGVARVFG